jgi:thiamine-monophosphate kinase
MKISDVGEFGLIERIRKTAAVKSPHVKLGIGDDAAALSLRSGSLLLATSDMLLEGVHFDLSYCDFHSLGHKSASVNLSDIAAMGGEPRFCLTSIGVPATLPAERIAEFYLGLNAVLRAHRTALVGGDTCSSPKGFVISVCVLGEFVKGRVMTRSGAKPGDRIFVTGTLGDSAAGMELLRSGLRRGRNGGVSALILRHLRPEPRVEWGKKIARLRCATAMIDVSDGLSSDLARICGRSKVGAVLQAGRIPLSPSLLKNAGRLGRTPLSYAISGGEDYELLFTVSRGKTAALRALDIPLSEIGEITSGPGLFVADEAGIKPMKPEGYDHFPKARPGCAATP